MISCSPQYIRYAAVAVMSLTKKQSRETNYSIFIFCTETGEEEHGQIQRLADALPGNNTVRLINTNHEIKKRGFHFSVEKGQETAVGLLAAELLPQLERIIAVDSDVIIKRDLMELFTIPMEKSLVAGVRDYDFVGQYFSGNRSYIQYYDSQLKIREPENYLQGGVLVMNLSNFRSRFAPGELFSEFVRSKYKYDEQDFLNIKCTDFRQIVDPRWNVLHDNDGYRRRYVIELGPREYVSEYLKSREEPWIIHFAGTDKPWINVTCDFAQEFWDIVRQYPETLCDIPYPPAREKPKMMSAIRKARNEFLRKKALYLQGKRRR